MFFSFKIFLVLIRESFLNSFYKISFSTLLEKITIKLNQIIKRTKTNKLLQGQQMPPGIDDPFQLGLCYSKINIDNLKVNRNSTQCNRDKAFSLIQYK